MAGSGKGRQFAIDLFKRPQPATFFLHVCNSEQIDSTPVLTLEGLEGFTRRALFPASVLRFMKIFSARPDLLNPRFPALVRDLLPFLPAPWFLKFQRKEKQSCLR
jgi:hypothetical protein